VSVSPKIAARCRRLAGAERCPVVIIPGLAPPRATGERGSNEFRKGGGLCKHPGGAIRAGYKVRYVRSTYRVEVGRAWLALDQLPPAVLAWNDGTIPRLLAACAGRPELRPILADALLDAGLDDDELLDVLRGEASPARA
jgi:hypothetical protein